VPVFSAATDVLSDNTQTATIRVADETSFASVSGVLTDEPTSTIYTSHYRDFKPFTHTVEVKVGDSIDVDFESVFQFGPGDTLDSFYEAYFDLADILNAAPYVDWSPIFTTINGGKGVRIAPPSDTYVGTKDFEF